MAGPESETEYLQLSVSRCVAEAPSLEAGIEAALRDVCQWTDWVVGHAWMPTGDGYVERLPVSDVGSEAFARFRDVPSEYTFAPEEGVPGRVLESHEPVWFPDVSAVSDEIYPRTAHAAAGIQAGLGVPFITDGELILVLEFYLAERRDVDEGLVEAVNTVADELGALVARKQAEDALEEERDLLEQIMEAAPVGISVFTRDGALERANSRALALHDVAAHEPGSRHATEGTFYTEDGDRVRDAEQPFRQVRETGRPVRDWIGQVETGDGDRRWLSVDAAPLLDDGEVARVVVIEEDITRLKEQARRLERQRDDLRKELDEIFTRIDDAFYALDPDWRFTYVNERAEELLGYARGELYGERFWDVFPEAAADDAVTEAFHAAMETQESTR
jgi:PAS domain S-box-containing protein